MGRMSYPLKLVMETNAQAERVSATWQNGKRCALFELVEVKWVDLVPTGTSKAYVINNLERLITRAPRHEG